MLGRYKPLTSVIITCYNYGRFLEEALQSTLNQESQKIEVIIMDDCSTDNTQEIGEKWSKEYGAKYLRNEINLGTPRNIDCGIRNSEGEYIVHLDADNRLRPSFIEKTREIMEFKPEIGIVYTDCAVFGPIARQISSQSTWWRNKREEGDFLIWEFFDFDRNRLRQRNYIHGGSLFRRQCWEDVKGYETCIHPNRAEDYSFWYHICLEKGWNAHYLKEPLLEYRMHSREQRSIRQPKRP